MSETQLQVIYIVKNILVQYILLPMPGSHHTSTMCARSSMHECELRTGLLVSILGEYLAPVIDDPSDRWTYDVFLC